MENIFLILFGLIIGSFLNVVIYRLPLEKSVVTPGSYCVKCGKSVKFYDNIPVLSYLILLGKCRHCGVRISPLYPLVEILTAFCFWFAYYSFFPYSLDYTLFSILFLCIMIVLVFIDLFHQILPNELTIGGAVIFLLYTPFNARISLLNGVGTSLGSAFFFWALYYYYIKVRKKEGLGGGDIKLMLLIGAFLGLNNTIITIVCASFSGLIVGLFFIIFKKKDLNHKLPFGTFLGFGSFLALFWGDHIMLFLQQILNK